MTSTERARSVTMICASVLAALLFASSALADPGVLTEREAPAVGERMLREQRWDDAIAAFAQADKTFPLLDWQATFQEPRTVTLVASLEKILLELTQQGAPDEKKLPYWDFYVKHYPFYATEVGPTGWEACQRWLTYVEAAGNARWHAADHTGQDPRFAVCRQVAAIPEATGFEPALALLAGKWPDGHGDACPCAVRLFRMLDRVPPAEGKRMDAARDRAWAAFARRFPTSPVLGAAAVAWRHCPEAVQLTRNPTARRWCLLEQARECMNEPERGLDLVRGYAAGSGPWFTPAQAEVWAVQHCAERVRERAESWDEALRLIEGMKKPYAGSAELGLALYVGSEMPAREGGHLHPRWRARYLGAWRKEFPNDPFWSWAVLERLRKRTESADSGGLSDAERAQVQEIIDRWPGEALAPFAELTLAADDARRGDGSRARDRYERILRFDPGGVRSLSPRPAQWASEKAREFLSEYYAVRDPRRLPELLHGSSHPDGFVAEGSSCGNCGAELFRTAGHRRAYLLRLGGDVEGALRIILGAVVNRDANGLDAGAALEYADLCLELGRAEDIRTAIGRLQALVAEEKGKPNPYDLEIHALEAQAALLQACLDAEAWVGREGLAGVEARLPRLLEAAGDPRALPGRRDWVPPAADALLRSLARRPELVAQVPAHLPPVPSIAALALASVADDEQSVNYVIDALLGVPRPSTEYEVAGAVLCAHPRTALRCMLERMARQGAWLWAAFPEVARATPVECWRVLGDYEAHPDPAVRDLARMTRIELQEQDPWGIYCVSGK